MSEKQMKVRAEKDRRAAQRLQLLLWMLEDWMLVEDAQGMVISSITVRHGRDRGGDILVIVKALFEGQQYVGFHSAATPEDAIRGALDRVRNNTVKWKEDAPYVPQE